MKNLFILVIVVFTFFSCTQQHKAEVQRTQSGSTSANMEEFYGAQDVMRHFGGWCYYYCDTLNKKNLTVELDFSDSVEHQKPSSFFFRVAYTFWRSIKADKNKYDTLTVVFLFRNGYENIYAFPVENLNIAVAKMPLVNEVVKLIHDKKYDSIKEMIGGYLMNDTFIVGYNAKKMIDDLRDADATNGQIIGFFPYDCHVYRQKGNLLVFQLFGEMSREKSNNKFNIIFNGDEHDDKIYLIKYKLRSDQYMAYQMRKPKLK